MIELADSRLRVLAPMTIANARALLGAGQACLRSAQPGGVSELDLSVVDEVDSAALSLIFAWLRSAGERGLALRVVNPPASLLSLAELYGVSELLPVS